MVRVPFRFIFLHEPLFLIGPIYGEQVKKAVLFNLIVERLDAEASNSLVDQSKHILEHDNKRLGSSIQRNWLFKEFMQEKFIQRVVDDTLYINSSITEVVSEELAFFKLKMILFFL